VEYAMSENTQIIETQSASFVQSGTATVETGESLRPGQLNNDSQDMRH